MMDIRPLRTEATYNWALNQIELYFERQPEQGTPDADRFDVLSALIERYEIHNHRVEPASEFLSGRRDLSMAVIAAIRAAWGIPADLLMPQMVTA